MSAQPEALRLAELFEIEADLESLYRKTAAELRRLHEDNNQLRAQRDALLETLKLAYGKNFVRSKTGRATNIYAKTSTVTAKAEANK